MQPTLTPKQQRVLDYLRHEIATGGQVPSLRQAAAELGVSHAAIAQIIKALEEKGYLKREGRYSRTVHLLNRTGEHRHRNAGEKSRSSAMSRPVCRCMPRQSGTAVRCWTPPSFAAKISLRCALRASP